MRDSQHCQSHLSTWIREPSIGFNPIASLPGRFPEVDPGLDGYTVASLVAGQVTGAKSSSVIDKERPLAYRTGATLDLPDQFSSLPIGPHRHGTAIQELFIGEALEILEIPGSDQLEAKCRDLLQFGIDQNTTRHA